MKEKEKIKYPFMPSMKYILGLAWKHNKDVIFMCIWIAILKVGLNLAELLIAPEILRKVEYSVSLGELLGNIGVFSGVIFVLKVLTSYAETATRIPRINVRMRVLEAINLKSLVTAYPNCDNPELKKLQVKAMNEANDNRKSSEYIWTTMTNLMFYTGGFLIYLTMLSDIDTVLIVVTIIISVLNFVFNQKSIQLQNQDEEEIEKNWWKLWYLRKRTESIEAAKDIRVFGLSDWIKQLYESVLKLQTVLIVRREKQIMVVNLIDVVLNFLQNGIAYFYLLKMAIDGNLSASQFLLYFSAITGFTAWINGILEECSALYRQSQGLGSVLAYLNIEEPFCFEGGRDLPDTTECELRLENVTFRYPGAEKNLFENLNLIIHSGEKLAVVGLNGAGKTTLVKLLCGFYDPDEGKVTLNGIDIREFNRREYYGLLCALYQNFSVLNITIAENVAQTVHNIDERKVWECLELAGLSEFVRSLPKGLDTYVGRDVYLDGILLSGGQMQRLMLARALYKSGPILVLDEPTAALDPIAERDIYEKYNSMTNGKTSIFISHRLASTRFCDRILFIENGAIAEEGSHEELLTKADKYAKLYEIQSRYYQEGAEFCGERD